MLTPRFENALTYAFRLHASQTRKGKPTPYIAHLMAVAALVLEHGGDEDMAIAALLHDAVEDQGGMQTLEAIRAMFGERVAGIVDGCTDAYTDPKPAWRERKETYLQHLRRAGKEVRLVSLADKLHNARTIVEDLRQDGIPTLERFRGGVQGTMWYYRSLADIFRQEAGQPMASELDEIVTEMANLIHQYGE